MNRLLLMLAAGWMLALSAQAQADSPRFEAQECPFYDFDGQVRCGILYVPLDRQARRGPQAELQVAIIASTSPNPAPDPVIYLEGGPGGSAVSAYTAFLESALRARSDIILLDQRGTGYSRPSLNCTELDEGLEDSTAACAERLRSEGIDLSSFTSAANAQDVADLIEVLGYEQANLFGVSYGTRLALTVMRDRPERIRSVILDAVYPPNVQAYEEGGINAQRAFEVLFADCEADAACAAAFPDLAETFIRTVEALNADPMLLEDEFGETSEFTGDDFLDEIFGLMYDTASLPYLPASIAAASARDPDFLSAGQPEAAEDDSSPLDALDEDAYYELLARALGYASVEAFLDELDRLSSEKADELLAEGESLALGGIDDDSEGMYNSLECAEEVPFNRYDEAVRLAEQMPLLLRGWTLLSLDTSLADCQVWGVPALEGAIESAPVVSDIPTLVLSGNYDPVTPPSWGQAAADYLSRSLHLAFPAVGHGAVDVDPCATSLALAFLANPLARLDTTCLAESAPPRFVTP